MNELGEKNLFSTAMENEILILLENLFISNNIYNIHN